MSKQIMVRIENLHPGRDNPRFEAGDVTELAESIRENDVLQSLVIYPATALGEKHYYILAGERRWTAARHADITELPCRVIIPPPGRSPAAHATIIGLTENGHRKDLNAIEKAKAFGLLRDEEGMSQQEIAEATGFHPTTVSRHLAFLEFSSKDQERIRTGELKVKEAEQIILRHRAKARTAKGHQPADVGWEPDHFTERHFLARKAKAICDNREHNNRRRRGGACDQCWEFAIRIDEAKVQKAAMQEAGFDVPYQNPVMAGGGNGVGRAGNS